MEQREEQQGPRVGRLSEGLRVLFGEPPAAGGGPLGGSDAAGASERLLNEGGSSYLKAYAEEVARGGGPFATGLDPLDEVLAGGFDHGLSLVGGGPGSGKTLLLEETARAALNAGALVVYASLREGALGGWARLLSRFSRDTPGLRLLLADVRGRSLDRPGLERLAGLDAQFEAAFLSRLVLLDRLPPGADGLAALMDVIWWRQREAREAGRAGPLVLIDDLQALLLLLDDRRRERRGVRLPSPEELVSALNIRFTRLGVAAVASLTGLLLERMDVFEGRALLWLEAESGAHGAETGVGLEVVRNSRTGWTGRIPLVLDRTGGLLRGF